MTDEQRDQLIRESVQYATGRGSGGGSRETGQNNGVGGRGAFHAGKAGAYCQRCSAWRGELGSEGTPSEFVSHLVQVFREVRRVLHPSGSLWCNLGDSYQDKQLLGIPWRVALALRDDGWWLRSDVIWDKPNCMPDSTKDRPTCSHEHLFLLTKTANAFFDMTAVAEPAAQPLGEVRKTGQQKYDFGDTSTLGSNQGPSTRHLRTVWRIPTASSGEDHFAAYPPELVRRPVLASTSEHGCCSRCLASYVRVVEAIGQTTRDRIKSNGASLKRGAGGALVTQSLDYAGGHGSNFRERRTVGWRPGCRCCVTCDEAGIPLRSPKRRQHAAVPYPVEPAVVLDPFCGTGTTLAVAVALGRRALGFELQPKYVRIAERRLRNTLGLFSEIGLLAPTALAQNGHAPAAAAVSAAASLQGALAGLEER